MEDIILRTDLREKLEGKAKQEARTVSELVNEAVEYYLRDRQRAKLDREIAAYETMVAELRQKYPEQWVAVHDQKLVDHDSDRLALYRRIRSKYGRTSVLLRQVSEHLVEEVWVRTPSTGRIAG